MEQTTECGWYSYYNYPLPTINDLVFRFGHYEMDSESQKCTSNDIDVATDHEV